MSLLLIALLQASAPVQETRATLQSCETTDKGWVCHYQVPAATIVRPLEGPPATITLPSTSAAPPPAGYQAATAPPVDAAPEIPPPSDKPRETASIDRRETARQTRLIARCADAKWYSPCLPGERKEARLLRDAAASAAELKGKVTMLLSEKRCDDAVKAALEGGDLALAREAREFCAAPR
ncbi:hypothetical protein [uncultured Caulobacter sp.]|uniref:hypothetical protein n=1 Tax=uncultured Caulobacter sp. TaxID=158749 RepID=UPI0026139626|nr:hypothetical protein [uncultured Caulobacter sp.]